MTRSFPHLGFDPTPGDPSRVQSLARQLAELHTELANSLGELGRLDTGAWKGEAATAFVSHVDHDVTPLIKKAHDSFERASSALSRWAGQLQRFQAEADALEREAATKQGALDQAKSAAGMPPDQHHLPNPRPGAAPEPDTAGDAAAESKKKRAVSDASDALDGVRHRAEELHHRYTQAAKAISHELDKAGDIAPDKPGLFHRIAHSVEGAWDDTVKWVEDHAELIKMLGDILSVVTGILATIAIFTAPFEPIGAIFAGAALIAGAATLATHLVAMAAGADVSWMTLGFDVLGVIPGIQGFTTGSKIAGVGRIANMAEAESIAARVTGAGGKMYGVVKNSKKFILFGDEVTSIVAKGSGIAGRSRAAVEGAIQLERTNQIVGTKVLNPVLTRLGRDPLEALSHPARVVDSTIKIATKVPGFLEVGHDVKTFDKDHPEVADSVKTAARAVSWVASNVPG